GINDLTDEDIPKYMFSKSGGKKTKTSRLKAKHSFSPVSKAKASWPSSSKAKASLSSPETLIVKSHHDVVNAVKEFFSSSKFPPGSNSSFITLIPKSLDAKMVKDFRPISLIGSFYKIVAKILSNRLCIVVPDLISDVQTAFISKRQILDGPFVLNELISWCKYHKIKAIIFKADFEKAFDLDHPLVDYGKYALGCMTGADMKKCVHLRQALGMSCLRDYLVTNEYGMRKDSDGKIQISQPLIQIKIHALHGSNTSTLSASYSSLWSSIIKECNALKSQGLDLISHCKIRVGNGMSTSFWHDQWLGDSCLRLSYPRLFALENNKVCSVAAKMSAPFVSSLRRDVRGGEESAQLSRISDLLDTVVLSNMGDRRFWDLNGDGCFRVKDVRRLLDDMLLPKSDVPSRWVKQIPIKVNVLAWKISMDRLPTRVNLHRRGVQVSPISCPICCEALENLDHLLFCCDLAKDIARFNQVQNKCWKECFTLPGGVSGHIETISSSLIQIFEKMILVLGVLVLNGTFSVKDARYRIDQNILPTLAHTIPLRDKSIPRKVNVFMWRLSLDRLPHRLNLSSRGMDIPAISCPSCNANVESANHVFFECDIATDIVKLGYLDGVIIPLFQLLLGFFSMIGSSLHASKEKKHMFLCLITTSFFFGGFGIPK
ncbi:RNA-directed DNA polymerase, eukaryota, partial [Tanacetum coccineum]